MKKPGGKRTHEDLQLKLLLALLADVEISLIFLIRISINLCINFTEIIQKNVFSVKFMIIRNKTNSSHACKRNNGWKIDNFLPQTIAHNTTKNDSKKQKTIFFRGECGGVKDAGKIITLQNAVVLCVYEHYLSSGLMMKFEVMKV